MANLEAIPASASPLSEGGATEFQEAAGRIATAVNGFIQGKSEVVDLALVCLLAEGHLLLEDVPGVGKTSLARSLAGALGTPWQRIQFTPDLLPGDVTGVSVFHQDTNEFVFHPGPVFANFVLADEVNRASPRTQSALLEVMEERQVTVDGHPYRVKRPFLVIATQNPIEMDGTYPLPEAQLDRFLVKTRVGYPDHEAEVRVLVGEHSGAGVDDVRQVSTPDEIATLVRAARSVHVASQSSSTWCDSPATRGRCRNSGSAQARAAPWDCCVRVASTQRSVGVPTSCPATSRLSPSRCSPTASSCRRRSKRRVGLWPMRSRRQSRPCPRRRPTCTGDAPRRRPSRRWSRSGGVGLVHRLAGAHRVGRRRGHSRRSRPTGRGTCTAGAAGLGSSGVASGARAGGNRADETAPPPAPALAPDRRGIAVRAGCDGAADRFWSGW